MPYTLQESLPFAKNSETSYQAALSQIGKRGPKTKRYLILLASGALTDHQAAASLRLPLSSICSIRNGAVACALVEKAEDKRPSPFGGNPCQTWRLTDAGCRAVETWRCAI